MKPGWQLLLELLAGIVNVDGPHGEHWVARFPFTVGRPYPVRLPYYLLTAAILLASLLFFWGRDEPRGSKLPRRGCPKAPFGCLLCLS